MEKSPSFSWPIRSAHTIRGEFDPYDDLRTLRRQRDIFRLELWQRSHFKTGDHLWDLAEKYGCVFPDPEDELKCWEVYKKFDKTKLPSRVVAYFDMIHLRAALDRHEKCLVGQIRQLRREKCRRIYSRIKGDVSFVRGGMERWLNNMFHTNTGFTTANSYKKLV